MKNNIFTYITVFFCSVWILPSTHAQNKTTMPQPGLSYVAGQDASGVPGVVSAPKDEFTVTPKKKKNEPQDEKNPNVQAIQGETPVATPFPIQVNSTTDSGTKDGAIELAMDQALEYQVRAMREERQRQMPYLDRMYIKTSITPLKVQRREEFLRSGAKDLPDLIQRAKSVHTQARAGYENINLYHRRILYAFRKLFPEASISLNQREGVLSGSAFTGRDGKFSLRQPIFNGGVLWNTFLQEKSSLEAAKKQYDKIISDLIFDLSRAYFEYQRTRQTLEEHESVVAEMKKYADMSEEKFRMNLIAEIEHLNVQSLYSQMQFDLENAKQDFEISKLDIQRFLDLSPDDTINLATTYDLSMILDKTLATEPAGSTALSEWEGVARLLGEELTPELPKIIDLSYANRPELKVEAAKLQVTRLGERIRWGEFLPKAFLTWEAGKLGEAYRGIYIYDGYKDDPDLKREWRLMLELNWNVAGNKVSYTYDKDKKAPSISQYLAGAGTQIRKNNLNIGILDGLDAYVNVKQAEVDKLNQVVELEKAEKQVIQDVKQAFYDYQKSLIQVRSTTKRAKWRERLRDLAKHRLERKEVEISEYIQAEADLVRERGDLHRTLKDYYSAKSALNHAVGIQDYLKLEGSHGI